MNGRKHSRTKLERECHLIGSDGIDHPAALVDISLNGALVTTAMAVQLKIGDLCDLILSLKSAEKPIKRTCKIVRLDAEIIGVTFLS